MGFCSGCMAYRPGTTTSQSLQKALVALPVIGLIPYAVIMCSMNKKRATIDDAETLKHHNREVDHFRMAFVLQLILLLVTPAVLAACNVSPWEEGWSNHIYEIGGFEAIIAIPLFYTIFQILCADPFSKSQI